MIFFDLLIKLYWLFEKTKNEKEVGVCPFIKKLIQKWEQWLWISGQSRRFWCQWSTVQIKSLAN